MKRFIDLGTQLYLTDDPECREFAFYCTSTDKFETFGGIQTWATVEDFKEDYDGDDLDRYLNLIPKIVHQDYKDKPNHIESKITFATKEEMLLAITRLGIDLVYGINHTKPIGFTSSNDDFEINKEEMMRFANDISLEEWNKIKKLEN